MSMMTLKLLDRDYFLIKDILFTKVFLEWCWYNITVIPVKEISVMDVLLFILGILFFLVMLMVSIGLHEGGHMYVAKRFKGVQVPKFFIGFGRTLWSFKTKKTEYGIKAIPLGGFVVIEDENVDKPDTSDLQAKIDNEELTKDERKKAKKELAKREESYKAQKGLLSYVAPWKRILIYVAGPMVNIVLGVFILYAVMMTFPSAVISNTVDTVNQCSTISEAESCEAEKAGLQSGDKITAVNGQNIAPTEDLSPMLRGEENVTLTVERGDETLTLDSAVKNGYLGINLTMDYRALSFSEATITMEDVLVQNLISLSELPEKIPAVAEQTFTGGERDPEAPSSLIHAGKTYGDTTADEEIPFKSKIHMLLLYSGLINIAIGFINLLIPLMPLDGGRILIAIIDQGKMIYARLFRKEYKPLGEWEVTAMAATTGIMVFAFMGLLLLSDIVNIFRGQI